jgi:hypothetical protein
MPQIARPVGDVSNSGWTPQTVFDEINEVNADDASYVASSGNPQGDTFEVYLASMALPDIGPQILKVRVRNTGPDQIEVTAKLMDGTTLVAIRLFYPTQSFVTYEFPLTAAEIARIVNYEDLTLRVTAGPAVSVPCCPNRLPEVLVGNLTNKTGALTCLPDQILLTTVAPYGVWNWDGSGVCGPGSTNLSVTCRGADCNGMNLQSGGAFLGPASQYPDSSPQCRCSPVNLVYTVSGVFGAGSGGYTLTVTEVSP